jgi:hypothetical protein
MLDFLPTFLDTRNAGDRTKAQTPESSQTTEQSREAENALRKMGVLRK